RSIQVGVSKPYDACESGSIDLNSLQKNFSYLWRLPIYWQQQTAFGLIWIVCDQRERGRRWVLTLEDREKTAIFGDTRVAIAHNSTANERWDSFLSLTALSFLQSQWRGISNYICTAL
ncbi:MAG: hypothetical protein ACOVS5_00540, partial [Oligoflexus sp.]